MAPSPPKPHNGGIASGAGIRPGPCGPRHHVSTDALFAAEVQSFLASIFGWLLTVCLWIRWFEPFHPKGNQRSGGDDLASHFMNIYDNDEMALAQVRGTVAQDLHGALAEFEATATGTRCQQPLYSLSINPSQPMSRDQYFTAIERIEDRLVCLASRARSSFMSKKGGNIAMSSGRGLVLAACARCSFRTTGRSFVSIR
jgi:hypothetical protein